MPGDLINATLVVVSNDAYLKDVKKVGNAPLEKPPADAAMPPASSGFELLKLGQPVPNGHIRRPGRQADDASTRFAVRPCWSTFIYTSCPMPTFCPLMDRNFATIQNKLKADKNELNVHLLTRQLRSR